MSSLFRYLFPRTHLRLNNRLIDFRLDTLPSLKLRAQSRIYQAILRSQQRRRDRRLAGKGFLRKLLHPSRRRSQSIPPENAGRLSLANTTSDTSMASSGWTGEPRVPGQRRQKVLGYIKAANELRQSYQQQLSTRWQEDDYQDGMPGTFPDADIVRSGDEEMLLFPSYARRHTKTAYTSYAAARNAPGTRQDLSNPESGDADYWRREWLKYEDENAVVDVDVRGWIYSPQRGPLNRRNRLMLAVARRLSGIPAPNMSPPRSRESSQGPGWREKAHTEVQGQEEEAAAREAELIARRGQKEAEAASRGKYSVDENSLLDFSPTNSRSSSPARPVPPRMNTSSSEYNGSDIASLSPSQKRNSWNLTNQMTQEEIVSANEQLMIRLRPFMTLPLANTPITIFFFNDSKSQNKQITTDESGHFKLRAALDFIPTKVRVLVSENLSAIEDVIITESHGISIVSDIDDTIKHSAIASGAKEIFKNTFIRELGELTIPGVKEWYTKLASMGVDVHYVSNSPWQLYPLLRSYFKMAGLPPGSFHLKQYSGMLQGIFEPAAERKKGSLDRIMHDFPERKFILVGDSGEADLEVYTDIVQEHPGRVLGVFIRDVTSKEENNLKDFFYGTHPGEVAKGSSTSLSQEPSKRNQVESRPKLPERPKTVTSTPATENLIDFDDDVETPTTSRSLSYSKDLQELQQNGKSPPNRPAKPAKPSNLRSISTASPPPSPNNRIQTSSAARHSDGDIKKFAPPPPPAPRRTGTGLSTTSTTSINSVASPNSITNTNGQRFYAQNRETPPPPPPASRTLWQDSSHYGSTSRPNPTRVTEDTSAPGYLATARQQLATAYNALPAIRPQTSGSSLNDPLRRGISNFPPAAAAARFVTGATGGDPNAGGDGSAPGQPYDRKLEMWKRRWARSEDIMRRQGVVLRSWRNGSDVMEECVTLVERSLTEMVEAGHYR